MRFSTRPGWSPSTCRGKSYGNAASGPIKSPYNMGSSPILYKDMVLQCCDHSGPACLVAVDRKSGEQRWRTPRKSSNFGHYGTPLVIQVEGRPQVVVNAEPVIAYNPDTGAELWSCHGMKECVGPSPAFGHGLLYASSGRTGPVMAIDPRGRGDVTETHVLLHLTSGGPYVPTPLVYPHLMVPGDNGGMLFYNAACQLVLEGRIHDHFTSSPVGADGKIYWCSERGRTYVIDAASLSGKKPAVKLLSVNPLRGAFLATPAIAGGRLFLRTNEALYCIAETGKVRLAHAVKALPGTFAELKSRYEKHQAEWTNERGSPDPPGDHRGHRPARRPPSRPFPAAHGPEGTALGHLRRGRQVAGAQGPAGDRSADRPWWRIAGPSSARSPSTAWAGSRRPRPFRNCSSPRTTSSRWSAAQACKPWRKSVKQTRRRLRGSLPY